MKAIHARVIVFGLVATIGLVSLPAPSFAVTDIEVGRESGEDQRRVRIGIAIAESRKIAFQADSGGQRERWSYGAVLRKTLRARVGKDNHFYLKNWHLHTSPDEALRKGAGRGQLTITFYNRPDDGSLEELVSTMRVNASLEGSSPLFNFAGRDYLRVEPKSGRVAYDLVVDSPESAKDWASQLIAKYGVLQYR